MLTVAGSVIYGLGERTAKIQWTPNTPGVGPTLPDPVDNRSPNPPTQNAFEPRPLLFLRGILLPARDRYPACVRARSTPYETEVCQLPWYREV